jgi:hypothetical protein
MRTQHSEVTLTVADAVGGAEWSVTDPFAFVAEY